MGSRDPISKITKAKQNGGVAQAVQCLLCKLQFHKNKTKKLTTLLERGGRERERERERERKTANHEPGQF
jgi:hypothetical protein